MARDDPFAAYGTPEEPDDPFAAYGEPEKPRKRGTLTLTVKPRPVKAALGGNYDGDTFTRDGRRVRLQGVDAFELDQEGRTLDGQPVALGQMGRQALGPFAASGKVALTGKAAYGREAATVSLNGQDAGEALVGHGVALPVPRYLTPEQRGPYIAAQRDAIAAEQGAYAGQYQTPADYRAQGADAPFTGKILMDAEQAAQWERLMRNPATTPEQVGDWLLAQGHKAENVANLVRFLSRNPRAEANPAFQQKDAEGNPVQAAPRNIILRGFDAINEGIIDFVASPFDLAHMAVKPLGDAIGVDMADQAPVGVWLRDKWHGMGLGQRDEGSAPQSDAERYAQAFLRGTGSAVVPVGGLLATGSRLALRVPSLATQSSAGRTAVRESLVDAAKNPGTAAALEVGAGAGSYIGEEVAHDIAPGNPYAAVAGQVIGGLGGGLGAGGAARRMGTRPSGDRIAPPDAPERPLIEFEPDAPMVERDGALFARVADGREIPIPTDASGHPGVMWSQDGWQALVGVEDGAPFYGIVGGADSIPSPYAGLAIDLNGTVRPMGSPDAPIGAPSRPEVPGESDPFAEFGTPEELVAEAGDVVADIDPPLAARDAVEPMQGGAGRQELVGPEMPPEPRQRDVIDLSNRPRPLLDPATYAERLRAAERLEPGDVLPIPATRVADVDEAAAIERGRFEAERAPNPRDVLESRRYRSPRNATTILRRRGPPDLVTWLRAQGGLKPSDIDAGELRHYGIDNAPRDLEFARGEGQLGKLIDEEQGLPLDEAAMRAWEAGYFPDLPERPTVQEFMDALVSTHRGGNRVFHPDDYAEIDAYREAQLRQNAVERARDGGTPLVADRSEPAGLEDIEANAAPLHAYEDWGTNAPAYAGNIALDKLDTPQDIKRALVQVRRNFRSGIEAARRGTISHGETERLAAELNMTPQQLATRNKGEAYNAEQAHAALQILAKSGNELVNAAKRLQRKVDDGAASAADYVAFRQTLVRHAAIQEQIAGMKAETGRALSAFRITADSRNVKGEVLRELINKGGGEGGILDAAKAIVEHSDTPARLNAKAKVLAAPQFRDKALALLYFSQLSGVTTHAVNVMSNTMTSLAQIPEHFVGAGVGVIRKRLPGQADTDRILFSETGARAAGWLAGAKEGFGQFARTLRTGETSDGIAKVETRQRAFTGKLGAVIDFPTLLLAAEDELFKAQARQMDIGGMALRQARKEGLKGAAARARAAELKASPTPEMLEQAFDYARYVTFQRPLGEAGNLGMAFLNKLWPLRVMIPYVRTPTNLLKFAAERSPAAPVLWAWSRDFKAGGVRRDMAIARWIVGTGATMIALEAAQQGLITGGGPANDSAKRLLEADGWQPYSVRVGDKYYSYRRLDPFSTTLGLAADYVDLQSHMSEKEKEKVAAIIVGSTLQNLSSKTWLTNIANLGEATADWERYGDSFVAGLAGNVVPGFVNSTAKMIDPVEREASDAMSRIRSRIPFASRDLPARRDVLGRERIGFNGGGLAALSPVLVSERKNDLVANALLDLGVKISKPNDKIMVGGKSVTLTPQQYTDYQVLAGDILRQNVAEFIGSPEYRMMTPEERKEGAEDIIRAARKEARETLMLGEAPRRRPKAASPGLAGMPDPFAAYGEPAN